MKLYATTTSERASKGQGGNKYINFEITAGENQTVMLYGQLVCEETETENIYRLWNGDICVDTLRESKGKQKKDEKCPKCGSKNIDAYYGHCTDCKYNW